MFRLSTILRESRVLHFAVLGGVLFALAPPVHENTVRFERDTLEALQVAYARQRRLPRLTAAQQREVVMRAVEDEILYREALRLGLDRDDQVVRQRLIQKVSFLAEDLAGASAPVTEAALQQYFREHAEEWREPARTGWVHVFAPLDRRDALAALRDPLIATDDTADETPPALGFPFPLPRRVAPTPNAVISDRYGAGFVHALQGARLRRWSQPLRSKFGWHLVKVLQRSEAEPARLGDVREQVESAYLRARKHRALAAFLAQATTRYQIEVEGYTGGEVMPTPPTEPIRLARASIAGAQR